MAEDRSLDEFIGADEPSDSATEPAADAVDPADEGVEPDDTPADPTTGPEDPIEPMAETFAWSATAGECASCGATVEERWRDGDALVCGDCKAW